MKKPNHPNAKAGFSLVELLVVIGIMSVLMTAGAIGLGNLTAGKGTSTAIATAESIFEEARMMAISKSTKTRVMIEGPSTSGGTPSENLLRRMIVVYEGRDAAGAIVSGQWVLASRGYTLPRGTYFSNVYSKQGDGSTSIAQEAVAPVNEDEPPVGLSEYSGNYFIYEFNAEGIFSDAGASFIIGAGVLPPGAVGPRVTKSGERDFAGFAIWRNGRTSSYRSPVQMGATTSSAGDNFSICNSCNPRPNENPTIVSRYAARAISSGLYLDGDHYCDWHPCSIAHWFSSRIYSGGSGYPPFN